MFVFVFPFSGFAELKHAIALTKSHATTGYVDPHSAAVSWIHCAGAATSVVNSAVIRLVCKESLEVIVARRVKQRVMH